jgi:long-chain acyl-CoA synthetase
MHTFVDPLRRAMRVAPEGTAVVCGGQTITYAQFWTRCRKLAGALLQLGLVKGDRVAIVAANCHRYLEVYCAVPAAGLVVLPLNARHTKAELDYALRDGGVRVLITDRDPGELADAVERVIRLSDEYETLLEHASEIELGDGVHEDDLAGLFYTGGTTGKSKGVMLTHRNLIANTFHVLVAERLTAEDTYLVMAPMFHAAGTVAALGIIWLGARHVILSAFDPSKALDLIESERVTVTLGVPTMVAAIADAQLDSPRDVSSFRQLSHGGSPIATEVVRRTHKAFPATELVHLYGATETAPLATFLTHEERYVDGPLARSCGTPITGVEIRIASADGGDLRAGEVGEVLVRGPNVMQGYWNKPEETAAALKNGWYWTGDLGYVDERSHLFLVDRSKDMIVSGGENVYSTEVEEAIYAHPMVLEAAVFGVPDEKWGEAVHAVVVPRGDVTVEELQAHVRERIAGYKVPKQIELRTEPLPKSGAGKILKRELRARYWAGRDARVG